MLAPGNVQEVLDLGLHAVACSRASGLWVGDEDRRPTSPTAPAPRRGRPRRVAPVMPTLEWEGAPSSTRRRRTCSPPHSLELERDAARRPARRCAERYARLNELNRDRRRRRATRGSASSPPARPYYDVRQALRDLGLDDALRALGIRMLRSACSSRSTRAVVREFARGLDEVLVVEEKRPVPRAAGQGRALRHARRARACVGKRDDRGAPLRAAARRARRRHDRARSLARRGSRRCCDGRAARRALGARRAPSAGPSTAPPAAPFFCSGCPHNRSTDVPEGTLVGAGIGCHTMVHARRATASGDVRGLTQMGGEGAQWIGIAPFTETAHFVQNIGDGTLLPLGLAGRSARRSRPGVEHHLQDPLQRRGRDDRRAGRRRAPWPCPS